MNSSSVVVIEFGPAAAPMTRPNKPAISEAEKRKEDDRLIHALFFPAHVLASPSSD